MESSHRFGTTHLFLADSRLAFGVLNHLRHQALHRMFGMSREQENVLTVVVLLTAADTAYEAARRISGLRLHVAGTDAALGAVALRDAALGAAGRTNRAVPGFGTLVAFAVLGRLAAPGLRRAAHKMHGAERRLRAAEERVRRERIRRYVAAEEHQGASAA